MNIEVLDEKSLYTCWLSCNMLLIFFIRVCGPFYKSKLLGIENISDPMFWRKIHKILGDLELKIGDEKSKIPFDRPWRTMPKRAPQDRLCLSGSGAHQLKCLRTVSVYQALAPRVS